ncbi:MAG: site-specific DNA-methyltransferase [Dehalococcoidia bacterium]|nr:site-specific DNA-methyltransferase [Dehalococcoidia bacterium]
MSGHKRKANPVARESANIAAEQIEKLRDAFPEAVSEGKVDFDKLRAVLGEAVDERPERYSFTWAGKRDAIQMLQTPSRATLVPAPNESVNFQETGNIFIEGENLEVLKLLYKPYYGRVKMIYIDPPYNTGHDFIYRDNYTDPLDTYLKLTGQKDGNGNLLTSNPETSGRYHSAWLSMMYPRLFLARQLLREDGVIFVSIDDHEVHNLRLVMNEVFGEENFVSQVIVQSNPRGRQSDPFLATVHDYVLIWARNAEECVLAGAELSEAQAGEFDLTDADGKNIDCWALDSADRPRVGKIDQICSSQSM